MTEVFEVRDDGIAFAARLRDAPARSAALDAVTRTLAAEGRLTAWRDEQYAIARKLIEDNQDKIHAMASALLEWETIDSDQIDDIMNGRPPRPPKDWVPSASKTVSAPPINPDGAPAAA